MNINVICFLIVTFIAIICGAIEYKMKLPDWKLLIVWTILMEVLAVATILREYGYDSRRGQQYCGSNGDADVVGLPGVHIECKRVERLNIYDAIEQSKNDARDGENPVVMHRRNRKEWLVTMPLDDWMKIYGKALHDN